ncbi:hypothetical protein FS837_011789 [Tulasnella sp. UAMH 9824]|nr:hypothetical protein FS837_011789 [Tulasnella sp. UAMH 9824]
MPGGPLAIGSNQTTSLSKYFHDQPDPAQTSSDFCNSFWGPNDGGVEVLFARMRGAARTMNEVQGFWKKRIAIEEEYATKLAELAKSPLGTDEIGDLRVALDTLRAETDAQAAQRLTVVQTMKRDIETPSSDFIGKQNYHKKIFQASIEKSYEAKQTQEKYVEKAREKSQQTVQASEKDHQNLVRALGDTCKRWEEEWKTYCDQSQALEEERIEFIKDVVWAYANAVSTVCVSEDESCEKIRVNLELVEAEKEMGNFVKYYGTGPVILEPLLFTSYTHRSHPGQPKQRLAAFSRSHVLIPSMPALPEEPQEVGRAEPGAASIAPSGITHDASGQAVKGTSAGEDTQQSKNQQPQPPRLPSPTTRRPPSPTTPAAPPPAQTNPSQAAQSTDEVPNVLFYVKALYDYKATIPEEFDFSAGDIIAVTATPDDGWWSGMLLDDTRRIPGRTVFPSNFVCLF